ncbi:succinate-semialdehyde dehydrogenase/glutarate-semialdehyde dehydrogenase [Humibacillus xanthopallidus]|uniref:Succinate-semialdehyde dehydrogenase/glutarate-semialdehyde dehydrogenase n=1 Tax=Humibacillus xanthopallidus TaxID=412689 RepID=A0A543PUP8_9MICO|nr:NAD-dependent succinate-semialdehyde dehydrogenase [Humibacillus xanthopallidus]TQN47776.1 succinate-semialdehyde dehydrogenase/glutarate-semialdehyde dehydrogenase [Humibacillus xanthopallidus]
MTTTESVTQSPTQSAPTQPATQSATQSASRIQTRAEVVTTNPATGAVLRRYPAHDAAGVEECLAATAAAAEVWRETPLELRCDLLRAVGTLLRERREAYARLMTAEMGKPLREARAEIDKCAWNCDVVAERANQWLADQPAESTGSAAWVSYEPLGVVFAVMPWNFPFWQVLRFASAALVAGNAGLLKHSPDVTGCALAIEQLFADASAATGAPTGLLRSLVLTGEQVPVVTPAVVTDPRVAAVTLTGSERAGAAVASVAGASLKKSVLELGGSDPFVVLADADVRSAAEGAARSRFGNNGQSCVSAKRFVVVDEVADAFVEHLVEQVALLVLGDPSDDATTVGPMARPDLRAGVLRQVDETVAAGARLVTGGRAVDGPGCYVEPTVLDHVLPGMAAFTEETFGPVAAVIRARDDDHAVALANGTDFGLGASVWGEAGHALAIGRRIRSGALFVNTVVASDPRLPFGGIGRSGYGRELSAEGVREFTNVRTVVVA